MHKLNRKIDRFSRSVFAKDILQHLRLSILSGELTANQRLVEGHLAKEYGVSRGPVRSALHALEQQGLVRILPSGGAEVVGFSEKHALDLFDMRLNLEEIAARNMMKRSHLDTERIEAIIAAMSREGSALIELEQLDIEFHHEFIKLADNWALLQLWVTLQPVISDMLTLSNQQYTNTDLIVSNHVTLLQAIKNRNLDLLLTQINEQIKMPRKLISERFQQLYKQK